MELQYHGGNCLSLSTKQARVVIDDNLDDLGAKSVTKAGDICLFTQTHGAVEKDTKITIDTPGEYEISGISINGLSKRSHLDEEGKESAILYKIQCDDLKIVVAGHIYPELSDNELEQIGLVDVLCVPVGGNGYTLDGVGALQVIKKIDPKLVVPTHYADKALKYPVAQQTLDEALKGLAMEPKEKIAKLKVKPSELSDVTQLIVLERQ